MRAARFGLPLMLAIIGGDPNRFAPYVDLYKRALEQYEQPALPVGVHSLGFVAPTDSDAIKMQWPHYREQFDRAARERGWRAPTYEQFLAEVDHGSMYVGSPETVANRIAAVVRTLGLSRFDLAYAVGRVSHAQRMSTIELYSREVIPRVRELLATTDDSANADAVGSGVRS
jgi:alkanesulfonate monooxygenase SsuD/methylene tetrahydromethanopterin reductase-like flavin-dependent oxidoreductase (luciferase family)